MRSFSQAVEWSRSLFATHFRNLFADSLRILLRIAAICTARLLKLFVISVARATHNP